MSHSNGKSKHLAYHERAAVILQSSLPPNQKLLLLAISHHLIDKDHCWPSQSRLAKLTGHHRTWINHTIGSMQKSGLLIVADSPNGHVCHYEINWNLLQASTGLCQTDTGQTCTKRVQVPVPDEHTSVPSGYKPVSDGYTEGGRKEKRKEERREGGNSDAVSVELKNQEQERDDSLDDEDREELRRQRIVEQALQEIQDSLRLPKFSESLSELALEFRRSIRERLRSAYKEAGLPRPCREVQFADLAAAIPAEFDKATGRNKFTNSNPKRKRGNPWLQCASLTLRVTLFLPLAQQRLTGSNFLPSVLDSAAL